MLCDQREHWCVVIERDFGLWPVVPQVKITVLLVWSPNHGTIQYIGLFLWFRVDVLYVVTTTRHSRMWVLRRVGIRTDYVGNRHWVVTECIVELFISKVLKEVSAREGNMRDLKRAYQVVIALGCRGRERRINAQQESSIEGRVKAVGIRGAVIPQ